MRGSMRSSSWPARPTDKIVELDARPSDCLAIAASHKIPVYVSNTLFAELEDMSEVLEQINQSREEESDSEDE